MTSILVSLALGAFISEAPVNNPAEYGSLMKATHTVVKAEPIKRGAPLGKSPVVSIKALLKDPQAYSGKVITLEGVVQRCCQRKGCWMEIAPKKGAKGLRVNFKDYAFFVPLTSAGLHVRAEGMIDIKTLSKEDVEHMQSEGATITPDADGTATEVGFLAYGVELRRK